MMMAYSTVNRECSLIYLENSGQPVLVRFLDKYPLPVESLAWRR